MQDTLKFLRILIGISITLYLTYFFAPYLYEHYYSPEVLQFLFATPAEPILTTPNSIYWVLLCVHIAASFALFFQFNFARYIYLAVVIVNLIITSLSGIVAHTGLDMLLIEGLNMVDVLIIYIAFSEKEKLRNIVCGVQS